MAAGRRPCQHDDDPGAPNRPRSSLRTRAHDLHRGRDRGGVRVDGRPHDPHRAANEDEGRRAAVARAFPRVGAAARADLDPAVEHAACRADRNRAVRGRCRSWPLRRRRPSGDRVDGMSVALGGRTLTLSPVRFFSSARDAPRARRPTDAVLLFGGVALVGLASLARGATELSRAIRDLVAAIPGLFGWFWELSYDAALLWAVAMVIAALAARRPGLVRDQILALGVAVALAALITNDAEALRRSFFDAEGPAVYPSVRIAVVSAILATSAPHLALPVRRVGRWLVVVGAVGGMAIGVVLPTGVVAALA